MQTNINKEIRTYQEDVCMGLSLRQLVCSGLAIGAAAGAYFALRDILGQETVSWVCIVCASPVALAGFFTYDGMSFEKFLWAVWETLFLRAGPRVWKSENRYWQRMKKQRGIAAMFPHDKNKKEEEKNPNETA